MTNQTLVNKVIHWTLLPDFNTFAIPNFSAPIPEWPFSFDTPLLKDIIYPLSLKAYVPLSIGLVYFLSVHYFNGVVERRQIEDFKAKNPKEKLPKNLKKLKAVPYSIAKTNFFKTLVFLHNVFLCVYSVWTFVGMTSTIRHLSASVFPSLYQNVKSTPISTFESFWQSICNTNNPSNHIWTNNAELNNKGLTFFAYLFYLSKYYEILDTVIILLKGRPSSLLQSYHHSGAILCMWSGTRFMSAPIWIFVVFNSFIHSLMYAYFSLSCINIRLPKWFKQTLTTLQITQFIVGGSLAFSHLFVRYYDSVNQKFTSCVSTSEEALAVYINVFYLAPLTLLFAAFYVDSYKKKQDIAKKNA